MQAPEGPILPGLASACFCVRLCHIFAPCLVTHTLAPPDFHLGVLLTLSPTSLWERQDVLQRRRLKLRAVKGLTQGHTAARGVLTASLVCCALLPTLREQSVACYYCGGLGVGGEARTVGGGVGVETRVVGMASHSVQSSLLNGLPEITLRLGHWPRGRQSLRQCVCVCVCICTRYLPGCLSFAPCVGLCLKGERAPQSSSR